MPEQSRPEDGDAQDAVAGDTNPRQTQDDTPQSEDARTSASDGEGRTSKRRAPRSPKDIGLFQDIVLNFTHGVGCPERNEILSRLVLAERVELSPELAANVGRCSIMQADVIPTFADCLAAGLPTQDRPLWLEYSHKDRISGLLTGALAEGDHVPDRIGALLFADPMYEGGIDIFLCWHDQNHKLFFSYAIMVWDIPSMKTAAFKARPGLLDTLRRRRPVPPGIFDHVFIAVPPGMAEEMYIWHGLPAANDPRRKKALEKTRQDIMVEHIFLMTYLCMKAAGDRGDIMRSGHLERDRKGLSWVEDTQPVT
ncbi:hypothetical protein ACTVH1_18235 [Gluconobacter cerinus]